MNNQTPNSNRPRPLYLLLTPGFLFGLAVLLLNDFYLKATYGNFLTGKLSDFAGLFTFSVFLSAAFQPGSRRIAQIVAAAAFVWWKTPLANGFIEAWNSLGIISIARTIDYSDYVALSMFPLSWTYVAIASKEAPAVLPGLRKAGAYLVVIISVFAFTATSSSTYRTVTLPESYSVRESRVEIENILLKHERIKDLVPHVQKTVPTGNTNITLDQPLYFFELVIEENTCDSPRTRMSFMLKDREGGTELAAISVKFECGDYGSVSNINALDRFYIEHARALFMRHILSNLASVDQK